MPPGHVPREEERGDARPVLPHVEQRRLRREDFQRRRDHDVLVGDEAGSLGPLRAVCQVLPRPV
jgi:hypothetical protein